MEVVEVEVEEEVMEIGAIGLEEEFGIGVEEWMEGRIEGTSRIEVDEEEKGGREIEGL